MCCTKAEEAPKSADEIKKCIPGVSDRFVEDVTTIREKYANERYVLRSLVDLLVSGNILLLLYKSAKIRL